jgi:hypothetical protein
LIGARSYVLGSFIVPGGMVTLKQGTSFRGAVSGGGVVADKDVTLLHHGFPGVLPVP